MLTLSRFRGFVLPIALIMLWSALSHRDAAHSFIFVPLENVVASAREMFLNGELSRNWTASLIRTSSGFAIGSGIGIAVGSIMAISRFADRLINPLYQAVRQVPLMGFIPLISLWFGNGESSKLFIVSLAAFYPMVLNTYEGLINTEKKYLSVASVFKLGRWRTLRYVTLPSALPSIFTGLMQATAFAWLSSVGSEFFFNPGPGLGNMMLNAQAAFRMDAVLLSVIAIGVTGFGMNFLVQRASRVFLRWRSTR